MINVRIERKGIGHWVIWDVGRVEFGDTNVNQGSSSNIVTLGRIIVSSVRSRDAIIGATRNGLLLGTYAMLLKENWRAWQRSLETRK